MKIEISNLGRNKINITIPYNGNVDDANEIAEVAQREASKHTASRFIDTLYNMNTNEGSIEAGWHIIGTFKVVA